MNIRRLTALALALMLLLATTPVSALADACPSPDSSRNGGNHFWNQVDSTSATCTQPATAVYKCAYCDAIRTEQTGAALGHTWGSWTTVRQATCAQKGERTRTCSVCGEKETRAIDRLPHTWSLWNVTREATCTETGMRERTCEVCGERQTDTVDKLPHTWSDWADVVPATDHSSGTRARTCEVCGEQASEDYAGLRKARNADSTLNSKPSPS